MGDRLIIIFAKNAELGKVKTRLAKTIGDEPALNVYHRLLEITRKQCSELKNQGVDIRIYLTDGVDDTFWKNEKQFIQDGSDLGERMLNAFNDGFEAGYQQIVGIGTDLPDLKSSLLELAFEALNEYDSVFGPSSDGGYYLIGLNHLIPEIFINKPWSTEDVLGITLRELSMFGFTYATLDELNDIDTIEDLKESTLSKEFNHLFT